MSQANYSPGVDLIAEERRRQIEEEGYTPEHDHTEGPDNLAMAGAIYACPVHLRRTSNLQNYWPWGMSSFKPCPDDRLRELAKAGALIAAEMDDIVVNGYFRDHRDDIRAELLANPVFRAVLQDKITEQVPGSTDPRPLDHVAVQLTGGTASVRVEDGTTFDLEF